MMNQYIVLGVVVLLSGSFLSAKFYKIGYTNGLQYERTMWVDAQKEYEKLLDDAHTKAENAAQKQTEIETQLRKRENDFTKMLRDNRKKYAAMRCFDDDGLRALNAEISRINRLLSATGKPGAMRNPPKINRG